MARVFGAYYINLDRHADRRLFVEAELKAAGIEAERVSGVDGANVPGELRPYFFARSETTRLTPPQIGCSASHLDVMRRILASNAAAALVLEDDARLAPDLVETLDELLPMLPGGWDIVRLCRAPKRAFRPLAPLRGGRRLVRYSRVPLGRAGYLVSRDGAAKLLRRRVLPGPGDVEIAHPWLLGLDVYGVDPPPIAQERHDLPSTIRGAGRAGMSKLRRVAPDPRRVVFNMRKLGPLWWARCLAMNMTRRLPHPPRPDHATE